MSAPGSVREWVSFEEEGTGRLWRFDVTFLLSKWECIYGRGCQGVLTGPASELEQGCCSYGAHATGRNDAARVRAAAASLSDRVWQHASVGHKRGVFTRDSSGTLVTRLVDDACIFLNRPGFEGGAGCALHRAAVESGVSPMDLKPDVCWQLPLRRVEEETDRGLTITVTQWDRQDWGEGGSEFAWWCTEAPEAFEGSSPVWMSMANELEAMVGPDVFTWLSDYLSNRPAPSKPVDHPVLLRDRS